MVNKEKAKANRDKLVKYLKENTPKNYVGPKHYKDATLKVIRELHPLDNVYGDLVIEGIVVSISEMEHYDRAVTLKCSHCKDDRTEQINGDFRKFNPDLKCHNCNITMNVVATARDNIRKLLLQETDVPDPQSITCFTFGDDTMLVKAGEKIAVKGQLRSVKKHKNDKTYQRVFDIGRIKHLDQKKKMPTEQEIKIYNTYGKDDLIKSFAPHIQGMELCKEALIISLIGGVERDGQRGDINTFLVGDPGTAKTQLLKFSVDISMPSDYASGRSASAAGLLAGVDNLSDTTRVARAGPVVLCNGGMVAIDEMDKMNALDRSALHEAMESQQYSLKKIGINQTWEAKTVIIGAANPHGGNRWDPKLSIKDNVKLPDSLLSRFGLIFLIRDLPDKDKDLARARHVILSKQGKLEVKLTKDDLEKYINYSKSLQPELTDESTEALLNWWAELREESQPEKSPNVDNRVLEDLIRIADAYARLRFSDKVTEEDAQSAIKLLQQSLLTLGMNTPGQRAEDISHEDNKDEYLAWVFSKPITEQQAVVELLKKRKWWGTEQKALKEIQNLRNQNKFIENKGILE